MASDDSLYERPAFYDMLFGERRHDLPFYLELAGEAAGPILELGIGTGRVGLTLARAGFEVVGVERSAAMLRTLGDRLEAEPVDVGRRIARHRSDARRLVLGETFDLIICPFNGLAHFHGDDDLGKVLQAVAAHLGPSGRFAFDVLVPDPARLGGGCSYVPWFRDPETGEVSRYEERVIYDERSRIVTVSTVVRSMEREGAGQRLDLRLRQLMPEEIPEILAGSGFRLDRRPVDLGDVTGYVCRPTRPVPRAGGGPAR